MEPNYFAYISGIVTILSFILQLRDSFPAHREVRKAILYISLGTFIGSILGALTSVDITIDTSYGLIQIVLIIILIIITVALAAITFIAIYTDDSHKRSDLWGSIGFGVFIFFLVLAALAFSNIESPNKETKYSVSEVIMIADHAFKNKDYERAIKLYEKYRHRYSENDPRTKAIIKKIENSKQEMANDL